MILILHPTCDAHALPPAAAPIHTAGTHTHIATSYVAVCTAITSIIQTDHHLPPSI